MNCQCSHAPLIAPRKFGAPRRANVPKHLLAIEIRCVPQFSLMLDGTADICSSTSDRCAQAFTCFSKRVANNIEVFSSFFYSVHRTSFILVQVDHKVEPNTGLNL